MVDFSRRLAKRVGRKPLDPIELYDTLDRASDKGPLRLAQLPVLQDWHGQYRNKRDVILKLHTGQGKTLIGLLILQSKLNEDEGPAVYLCANNFLINQTCSQAKQFGIRYCTADDDLPHEFLEGRSVLVISVHKLFNGLTKFGLGSHSLSVPTVLMDDCHACIDAIRDAFTIKLDQKEAAYEQIRNLFAESLTSQGAGTYADIQGGDYDALLPVPYWDWRDRHAEVIAILSKHRDRDAVKFVWPLMKDVIPDCQCVVSGESLEIAPYLPPLDLFGSYSKAKHRVFMSATVTDDSFLVKGVRLSPDTVRNPLIYKNERWSGEKMLLVPSLIDESLDRTAIVNTFGKPKHGRRYGVVVLTPSFRWTADWKACGATIAARETIDVEIEKMKGGTFTAPLVIANRYDGIDLPDDVCRTLILDSKPYSDSLIDRYADSCRAASEITTIRTARIIEQGLGRSVRGEKDYCAFVITGPELVRTVRAPTSRKHLSNQTRTQIDIGLEIAEMAKEDIEKGVEPLEALQNLLDQCLKRDPDWKAFYGEKMAGVGPSTLSGNVLDVFQLELEAELKIQQGDGQGAAGITQQLIDKYITDDADRGWYLQEMARYMYAVSKAESNNLQVQAHCKNRFLMKPRTGMK